MRIFTGRRLKLDQLFFSPNGHHIACAGCPADSSFLEVRVLEVMGDGLAKQKSGMVTGSASFTADGSSLLFPSRDRWYRLGIADGRLEHDVALTSLQPAEVSSDGRRALVCDVDSPRGVIRLSVAEPADGGWRTVWERELQFDAYGRRGAGAHDHWETFTSVKMVANGTRILVGFLRREHERSPEYSVIRVLDTATGEELKSGRVAFSAELLSTSAMFGDWLVIFERRLLQVTQLSAPIFLPLFRMNSTPKHFTAAAFSPDGKLLATTSNDTTVTMWDTATWEPIRQYGWEIGRLRAVAFAPDGLTCAAGSDTGKVVLFDVDR